MNSVPPMPDNRQVKSNAVSNQSADNIEEAIWRLKIHDNQEGGGVAQSSPYPDRPGEPDCLFFLRTGLCGYGSNCRFNHPAYAAQGAQYREELPERVGQPDCGYYLKTGTCKYGSTCKYHHPKDRNGAGPVSFNLLGLPMRQDEKSCPYYMRTGSCKFGVACKFHHPQPSSVGTGFPVTGSATFGSMGSSVLPSSGLPYAGSLPTWSLPRSPYLSGPRLQGSQSYMPVIVSPSQGLVPAPGWNTYMGNIGPVSPSSIAGSNLIYNSRNQSDLSTGGQVHMLATSSPNLPERPDQPDCRYYMNTGTCKYGADCKFHHPKERIAQSAASNVGPLGLPSRPGQAVCSNYSMYGICKFGPTCRFDHPYAGYPFNYGLSLPPLSILDSPLMTHQAVPTTHSSDTSPIMSAKIPDWVQNSDAESMKHQNTTTKNSDNSSEVDHSPTQSVQNSSDPSHNQSN
ncbi:Zinc finger CCCH domain-containing protein [Melia azedarach]|uniref:Zinc finger CCCH domain-containing protein n=1 Tax=Melia azedarach TaxID=155640 RepID=A0ACC1Z468_MELAZ|nr:Zinc finger CCCH domain-containing protein [Melia azedarach]